MPKPYFYNGHGIVTPVEYIDTKVVYSSQSLSSKHLRTNPNIGQLWSIDFDIVIAQENIGQQSAAEFFVDLIDERTSVGEMPMPQFPGVDDYDPAYTGTYAVNANVDGGTATMSIVMPAGQKVGNKLLAKGTFIQFSNHTKVYVVKETVVATDANVRTNNFQLTVYPAVITALPGGTTIRTPYSTPRPTYRYWRDLSTLNGVTYQDSRIVSPGKIKLIEAL